ncbi:MAG: FAD-binding protein [Myxococcales bacterium]|nr:FAD-binding protein [Myxococcales bacterium]
MKSFDLHVPVGPESAPGAGEPAVLRAAAAATGLAPDRVGTVVIRRRSLDLRKRRQPQWVLRCDVFQTDEVPPSGALPPLVRPWRLGRPLPGLHPIIVGSGPAGLFAALQFADAGVRCTLLERGAAVEGRNLDVRDLRAAGTLDPESNLCFGEGGAGTYSDGKLFTRSKHPLVREVYERLVALGAGPQLLVDHHPHIGTNRLIPMVRRLREALLEAGHDLRFGARVDDLIVRPGSVRPTVVGVRLQDGTEIIGGPVLLATGHSARDTYAMLARHGVALQRKDFAVGARIEHPQALVDAVQLGDLAGHAAIGPAEYFLACQVPGHDDGARGVYSFCMCPGGFVLPTPTQAGRLNVNGMSNSNRGSGFANAALVAQVRAHEFWLERPGDLDADAEFGAHVAGGALLGLALQDRLEAACFESGGGGCVAPAQGVLDFVAGRDPVALPERSTYRPDLRLARVDRLLPSRITRALRLAMSEIDRRQLRGYLSQFGVVMGVETTTSAPVRIVRGDDLQSISHAGLYPCAEGAGYAGGIVSSAIDGMEAARAVLACHSSVTMPVAAAVRPAV